MTGRGRGRGKGRGRGRGRGRGSTGTPGGLSNSSTSQGTRERGGDSTRRPGRGSEVQASRGRLPEGTSGAGAQASPEKPSERPRVASTKQTPSRERAGGITSGLAVEQAPSGRLDKSTEARIDHPIGSGANVKREGGRGTSASSGASASSDGRRTNDHSRLPPESAAKAAISSTSTTSKKTAGPVSFHGKKQPPDRPGVGTKGRNIVVRANFFPVQLRDRTLYQYDVSITPKLPKRLNRYVYEVLAKKHIGEQRGAYDGSKSLYCVEQMKFNGDSLKIADSVKLPNEDPEKPKKVEMVIKFASRVDVVGERFRDIMLDASQRMPIFQALDVALRHTPSLRTEPIGRSFFTQPARPYFLGKGREVWSGHYQSLRPAGQWKLMLNVDIASTPFYTEQSAIDFMCAVLKDDRRDNSGVVTDEDRDLYARRPLRDTDRVRFSKEIKGVKIEVTHLSYPRKYKVNDVTRKSAREQTFPLDDGKTSTVEDYFASKHGVQLKYPHLPCLHVGPPQRNIFIPMEVCKIVGGQRCVKKLTDIQTAKMIRQTAQPADERERTIRDIMRKTKFNDDPVVKKFGMSVSSDMVQVPARVLQPPTLQYDQDKQLKPPEKKGAWDMKDHKFYEGAELNEWAVVNCSRYCREHELQKFISALVSTCRKMGMSVRNEPHLDQQQRRESIEVMMQRLRRSMPKLNLVVAVIDKGSPSYYEIKQVGDTNDKLCVATQCVLSETVQRKCNPATLANVCLKINAKLGGINNIIAPDTRPLLLQREPVIIFGADVTHPKSGDTTTPSIASVVASVDLTASKFRAKHHAQKHRQEVIANLKDMAKELLIDFYRETDYKPKRIIFFRDGVSEGQFEQIRYEEVAAIQQACLSLNKDYQPGITFVVVQKRHHTRLFPTKPEDAIGKGKNVPPGTTIDTDITHPFEFDFYLCSHAAIQGTSRPCHFYVLWDDNDFTPDDLQLLSYQLCHTFWRCNRSVSYPAPAYYAHRDAAHARILLHAQEGSSDSASVSSSSARSEADVNRAITVHRNRKDRMYFL